jgi:hypothetical protein
VPGIVRHRRSDGGRGDRDTCRAPDFAEPVRAWRVWYVLLQGRRLRLRSLFFPLLWEPGRRVEAECLHRRLLRPWRRRPHAAPRGRCDCGIYAATAPATAADYLRFAQPAPPEATRYALGRVSLWGLVLECERGWRGSYAYPAALYVPTRSFARRPRLTPRELAAGLAGYGVPVTVTDASDPLQLVDEIELGGLVAGERRQANEDSPGRAARGSGAEGAAAGAARGATRRGAPAAARASRPLRRARRTWRKAPGGRAPKPAPALLAGAPSAGAPSGCRLVRRISTDLRPARVRACPGGSASLSMLPPTSPASA